MKDILLGIMFAGLTSLVAWTAYETSETNKDIQGVKKDIQNLSTNVNKDIQRLVWTIDDVRKDIQNLSANISALNDKMAKTEGQMEVLTGSLGNRNWPGNPAVE